MGWVLISLFGALIICLIIRKQIDRREYLEEVIESADRGDEQAKQRLYELFRQGLTSRKHNIMRERIYRPKAAQGDSFAEYFMGLLADNNEEKLKWWQRAAEHGNVKAMRGLALGYSEFANDPECSGGDFAWGRNKELEEYWSLKAANTGNNEAMLMLGNFYYFNTENVDSALAWYEKAMFNIVTHRAKEDYDILFEVYEKLELIYGTESDVQHYNMARQKEMLIRILKFHQNHEGLCIEDFEEIYPRRAFELGMLFEYKEGNMRNATYCYVVAYYRGSVAASNKMQQLMYQVNEQDFSEWKNDADKLAFNLPM